MNEPTLGGTNIKLEPLPEPGVGGRMDEPKRYTVEELELIYKKWRGKASAIGLVPEFIEHLSSLQEQEEQPVEYISQETHQTGIPPKIEPLDLAGSWQAMTKKINELVEVVNQLASNKE